MRDAIAERSEPGAERTWEGSEMGKGVRPSVRSALLRVGVKLSSAPS